MAADPLTVAERSAHMRRIRKTDTAPEIAVRKLLHAMGFRYRLHRRDLPGTPDIVLPRHRKIVQVHGCFWHQHAGCRLARQPKSRTDYWLPKLSRNVTRDEIAATQLKALGWDSLIVWECETREFEVVRAKLISFLADPENRRAVKSDQSDKRGSFPTAAH